jgi:hypothetical protein
MDPLEGLVEPMDLFSGKCIQVHKAEIVGFIEFNEIFVVCRQ